MKRNLLLIYLFLALMGIVGFGYAIVNTLQKSDKNIHPLEPSPTSIPVKTEQVNIYLVAVDDNGKSGEKIGCNDSLIPVKQDVTVNDSVPYAALEKLLLLRSQTYGESGLYNALYPSDLQIDSLKIENGVAVVYLTGAVQLGGVCDNPRFEKQIEATLTQFPKVESVEVFINDISLQEILSEK